MKNFYINFKIVKRVKTQEDYREEILFVNVFYTVSRNDAPQFSKT